MSNGWSRPVRGGLPMVAALLVLGGVAILSMAPGGFRALPLVQYFESWSDAEIGVAIAVVLTLVVSILAFRRSRKAPPDPEVAGPGRFRWTAWRFASALILAPPFIVLGYWFTRGFEGVLVGPSWGTAYLAVAWLLGGFWLASAFHAFRRQGRFLLWFLAGGGIVLSIQAVRITEVVLGDWFSECATARVTGGPEYLLCSRYTERLRGFDYLHTTRICRVRRRLLDVTWYETLAETQTAVTDFGIYPEFGRLVRPERHAADRGRSLYTSADGFIASVKSNMECDLAYDTVTGETFGEWHARDWRVESQDSESFHRKGMESLPPFRLVEAGGRPASGDVSLMEEEAVRRAKELEPGATKVWYDGLEGLGQATSEKEMLRALGSRNELVRAAAERVIRAGGKAVYPEAFGKVR